VKVGELAICVLDANTLALGSVENVRAAITAGKAGAGSNQALAALASRDPNQLAGFGGNVTRALLDNLHVALMRSPKTPVQLNRFTARWERLRQISRY